MAGKDEKLKASVPQIPEFDPLRRKSNFSLNSAKSNSSYGHAVVKKAYEFDAPPASRARQIFDLNFPASYQGSFLQSSLDDESQLLAELEAPTFATLRTEEYSPVATGSRKGSLSNESFRRRSVSLPENIWSFDQTGNFVKKPARKINFGRSNSMPVIAEFGRLTSFPSDDYIASLPPDISHRVEGVNQRHTVLAQKKMILQARARAVKERDRRNTRRIPFFKTAAERDAYHKGTQPEDETEIYDSFPPLLFTAGFTGATFKENDQTKRELGKLSSYPKNPNLLSPSIRQVFENCEARRMFARTKKAELLKRGKDWKDQRRVSVLRDSIDERGSQSSPMKNPLFVRTASRGSELTAEMHQIIEEPPPLELLLPAITHSRRGSNASRISIDSIESDPKQTSNSAYSSYTDLTEENPPETPIVNSFPVSEVPLRRDSLGPSDDREHVRRPSREETEQKLKKWEQDFIQKQQERQKAGAPLFPPAATSPDPSKRRSSFSILDWKTLSPEQESKLAEKAEKVKRREKRSGSNREKRSVKKSMSLVKEEEEDGKSVGGSVRSVSSERSAASMASAGSSVSTPDLGSQNEPASQESAGEMKPSSSGEGSSGLEEGSNPSADNIFAILRRRRGSMPLSSMDELRALAEMKSAADFIEEFGETKAGWRISSRSSKLKPLTENPGEDLNHSTFVSTNPLFNLSNIDCTQIPEERARVFKEKFDTLSKTPLKAPRPPPPTFSPD